MSCDLLAAKRKIVSLTIRVIKVHSVKLPNRPWESINTLATTFLGKRRANLLPEFLLDLYEILVSITVDLCLIFEQYEFLNKLFLSSYPYALETMNFELYFALKFQCYLKGM